MAGEAANAVTLRSEDRAEEWHFDEVAHAAAVEALQARCQALKEREAAARERKARAEREAEDRIAALLKEADEEDMQRARLLSDLREQLLEAQEVTEQTREDCEAQVAQAQAEREAECKRRADLEAQIADERQQAKEARRRISEIEDFEHQSLAQKDKRLQDRRAAAKREIAEVQGVARDEVAGLERRLQDDLDALQQQLDESVGKTRDTVATEVQQRHTVLAKAESGVKTIDDHVRDRLVSTHQDILRCHDDAVSMAQEVQSKDFSHEASLREQATAAFSALGCALDEKKHATMREKEDMHLCKMTVKALGDTFPRSTQYRLHFDKKSRSPLATSALTVVSTPSPH